MRYFWLVFKHKWFVLLAGLRLGGVPLWRLLIHDWTKFLDYKYYNDFFFGSGRDEAGFAYAWLRHQNRHPHHWEYWIPRTVHNRLDGRNFSDNAPLDMPEWAIREMLADWLAASRSYEGKWPKHGDWPWLQTGFGKLRVSAATAARLRELLRQVGGWEV